MKPNKKTGAGRLRAIPIPDQKRFWKRVDKNGPISEFRPDLGPCWLWRGVRFRGEGYGKFRFGGWTWPAHRVAFTIAKGPVGMGLVPDHLCLVKPCVNPDHLEAVTQQENVLRSYRAARVIAEAYHRRQALKQFANGVTPRARPTEFSDQGFSRALADEERHQVALRFRRHSISL